MPKEIKTISTDVLIVGGGAAGLYAANKAAEQKQNVLVVEKARAGVGANNTGLAGGGWSMHWPEDDIEPWVQWSAEDGGYLNDQEWTRVVARGRYEAASELFSWGVPFLRDYRGNIARIFIASTKAGGVGGWPRAWLYPVERLLPVMLKKALEKGAKVVNHIYLTDLLESKGRVSGAVGFHIWTGEPCAILSKSTVLACGGCGFKAHAQFLNWGQGELMAFNAGAQLRNAEFGCNYMPVEKETQTWLRPGHSFIIENALGENLAQKYFPERIEAGVDFFTLVLRAMHKEVQAGRGPCYCNLIGKDDYMQKYDNGRVSTVRGRAICGYTEAMRQIGKNVLKERVEEEPSLQSLHGPVRVDLDCATTVPGLYAAGDTCIEGASWDGGVAGGAHSGTPLPFALISGMIAGRAAGKFASEAPKPRAVSGDIPRLTQGMLTPLKVKKGYSPYKAIEEIQKVVIPLKYNIVRHKDRLAEALSKIEGVKSNLSRLSAKDVHELVRCHQARGMAHSAEAMYRAALMRNETRGSHEREDYPERDDTHWLKWIIVGKDGAKMKLWTEPVPLEKYKYRPH